MLVFWMKEFNQNIEAIRNDPIAKKIFLSVHAQDKNFFGLMVGDTGLGKSGCAVSECDLLDVSFSGRKRFIIRCDSLGVPSHDTQVGFTIDKFLNFATAPAGSLPKGSFFVWDETGVENDNTQWFSLKSRIIKYVMQTSRYLNRGVFLTTPDSSSISIGSRRLLHWVFDVKDRKKDYCIVEPRKIYRFRFSSNNDFYFMPKFTKNGILYKVGSYYIPRPRPELELPYKKIKEKATQDWYKGYLLDVELEKMKDFAKEHHIGSDKEIGKQLSEMAIKGSKMQVLDIVDFVMKDYNRFLLKGKINKGKLNVELLKKGLKVNRLDLADAVQYANGEISKLAK